MIVCDNVWLWCQLLVSSCDKSQYSLVDETLREGIYNNRVPFGVSVLGR